MKTLNCVLTILYKGWMYHVILTVTDPNLENSIAESCPEHGTLGFFNPKSFSLQNMKCIMPLVPYPTILRPEIPPGIVWIVSTGRDCRSNTFLLAQSMFGSRPIVVKLVSTFLPNSQKTLDC